MAGKCKLLLALRYLFGSRINVCFSILQHLLTFLRRLIVSDVKEILNNEWPNTEIVSVKDTDECVQRLVNENVDGALLMTYTAQKLARDDTQNRLRVEVVPGASMSLRMGVLSEVDRSFCGLWEKTLYNVSRKSRAEIVQSYVEDVGTPTIMAYLFDHPLYLVALIAGVLLFCLRRIMH